MSKRNFPEEIVRKKLLKMLVEELGYPMSLISREVSIASLTQNRSRARVDLLCYVVEGEQLSPFLLIECKACKPTQKALHQIIGYNTAIQARFLAIIWDGGGYCIERVHSGWRLCESLPPYPKKNL